MAPAIGIDLGTTYSCVAAFINGKVQIFTNEQGNRITPSCVSFTNTGILVGEEAQMEISMNPKNTIYDSKRLIGRRYTDDTIKDDMKLWPFKIVNEKRIKIKVKHKKKTRTVYPEEISAHILRKMKSIAEEKLGMGVKDAVITVPAYFTDAQRQATKDAGTIAGLNVVRIINEPTAAAIAYGLDQPGRKSNVLIYDLGGGTFDVTIFEINDGVFEVKSTAGDTHLGGQDFTNNLLNYCVTEIRKNEKHQTDFDDSSIEELRKLCDNAKRALSSTNRTNLIYNHLNKCHVIPITRACFERLNNSSFHGTLDCVEKALTDAKMDKSDIDEIVMVGGSSRIPKIQSLLENFFNGKKLNFTLNPDECVAYGAAVQAAISTGDDSDSLKDIVLLDVIPYSLGIRTIGELMTVFIPRNTTIPYQTTMTFPTTEPDQTGFSITVYEGERPLVKDNNKLDGFIFDGLPPGPKGGVWMDLTFEVNVDGILKVSAVEKLKGIEKSIVVKNDAERLLPADIDRLLQEVEEFKLDDEIQKEALIMKNSLEEFCFQIKSDFKYNEIIATETSKSQITEKCNEIISWLRDNRFSSYEEYKRRYEELEDYFMEKYQESTE